MLHERCVFVCVCVMNDTCTLDGWMSVCLSVLHPVGLTQRPQGYRPSAQRSSILFFVMNDMGRIDPMYQFSLDAYLDLFDTSITKSLKHPKLEERINHINNYHTLAVYRWEVGTHTHTHTTHTHATHTHTTHTHTHTTHTHMHTRCTCEVGTTLCCCQ